MLDTVITGCGVDLFSPNALVGVNFGSIQMLPGGNGVFFAQAALTVGFDPTVIVGRIGGRDGSPDPIGQILMNNLVSSGLVCDLEFDAHYPTGQAVLIYQDRDRRIVIADRGASGQNDLSLARLQPHLEGADVVHVSGYLAIPELQRRQIIAVLGHAKSMAVKVAIDVAPHNIVTLIGPAETRRFVRSGDFISCELETFIALQSSPDPVQHQDPRTVHLASREFFRPDSSVLIRLNALSDFLWSTKSTFEVFRIPYTEGSASLRFTDQVFAQCISRALAGAG
ncbi:carbohydrate kinase family protein [Jatrophihabitans sp.]|uniref:carbohydrate kinase family protein n=1 Tax=Jatrophihabitans sp. TaxID=1932789 RepID=UPI0038CD641E